MRSLFFVGSCNRPLPYFPSANGRGIAAFWIDSETGECTAGPVTDGVDNPTFVAFRVEGSTLCATTEAPGAENGRISAYRVDLHTGRLDLVSRQPTHGDTTAQVSFDRSGRFAAVANYAARLIGPDSGCSVAVYPIAADGTFGTMLATARHEGASVHPVRQTQPHPHSVRWSPDNRFVVVADLGTDRLVVYGFDEATGTIARHREFALPAGSGPRDVVFHPALPFAYVPLEITSRVASLAFDPLRGEFRLLHAEPTVSEAVASANTCSAVKFAPGGNRIFVGNRGEDSIAVLDIDAGTGIARHRRSYPSGGKTPRDFALDPAGQWLVVANQNSDWLSIFRYRAESGELMATGNPIASGTPTAVAFAA